MESHLTPEVYRKLLDTAVRNEDDDPHQVEAAGGQYQQHTEQLSSVDWDVVNAVNAAGVTRLLGECTRRSPAAPACKRRRHKAGVQRPQVLPSLPAPRSSSPLSQHRMPDRLELPSGSFASDAQNSDDEDTRLPQVSPPKRGLAASSSKLQTPSAVVASFVHLPPLDMRVLQRRRVFLGPAGVATIGLEELVQLQERFSPPKPRPSPLQLTAVPKKCTSGDEVALMPCHSLQYRYGPSLSVECWREPVRDRDKNWSSDELAVILALQPASERAACAMTDPLRRCKGKWRHWEAMKLHIHSTAACDTATPVREQGLQQEILIRNQGAMISRTYCVVSVFGVGVYGRLYSASLAERPGASRFLRVEAYDPKTSRTFELVVTMSDLEWVLHSRQQLLVAGKKHAVVKQLLALLFFRYPDGDRDAGGGIAWEGGEAAGSDPPEPREQQQQPVTSARNGTPRRSELPTLCISPDEQLSDAARRRFEREERLRCAEAERLRAFALLMTRPKRARHRLLCQAVRVSGHKLVVSLYHYPAQVRSFVILAYHPLSSRTFSLTVGVMEAAALSRVFTLPHRWSPEQKLLVAQSLVPMLRFNGARTSRPETANRDAAAAGEHYYYASYRMSLAIREDRAGAPSEWLELPPVRTPECLRHEILRKYQSDGQRALQFVFDAKMRQLNAECDAKAAEVDARCRAAEAQKVELRDCDAELREMIEEINSGKSVDAAAALLPREAASSGEVKSPHELRREFKAERQRIKVDLKTLSERVGMWTRELAAARESQMQERARALKTLARATRALENEALVSTRGLYEAAPAADKRHMTGTGPGRRRACGQRTWLARATIAPSLTLLASGICGIAGRRCRCSVFRVAFPSSSPTHYGDSIDAPPLEMVRIQLYDPVSSQSWSLELAQLDWIAYTKLHHEAQLLVPELAIATSPVVERIKQLQTAVAARREALIQSYAAKPTTTTKKTSKKSGAANKTVAKQRSELRSAMQTSLLEIRQLRDAAPWRRMLAALGERLSFPATNTVAVDRCIFRATLPIVSLVGGGDDAAASAVAPSDDDDLRRYDVRVLQELQVITFEVVDPATGGEYLVAYPESVELAKEFAVETFVEQQMHLEAIAMTLLFFEDERTGKLSIRFED